MAKNATRNEYTEMTIIRGPGFIGHVAPSSFLLRDTDGTEWLTEWHPWHGPSRIHRKTGDELAIQPGEKSRFWNVAQWWKDQGGKVVDGIGMWKEPPVVERRYRRSGRRSLVAVGADYEGPDLVVERFYKGYEQWGPVRAKKGIR